MRVRVLAQVAHDLVRGQAAGQGAHHALPREHSHKQVGQDALAARKQAQDGGLQLGGRVGVDLQAHPHPCNRSKLVISVDAFLLA